MEIRITKQDIGKVFINKMGKPLIVKAFKEHEQYPVKCSGLKDDTYMTFSTTGRYLLSGTCEYDLELESKLESKKAKIGYSKVDLLQRVIDYIEEPETDIDDIIPFINGLQDGVKINEGIN